MANNPPASRPPRRASSSALASTHVYDAEDSIPNRRPSLSPGSRPPPYVGRRHPLAKDAHHRLRPACLPFHRRQHRPPDASALAGPDNSHPQSPSIRSIQSPILDIAGIADCRHCDCDLSIPHCSRRVAVSPLISLQSFSACSRPIREPSHLRLRQSCEAPGGNSVTTAETARPPLPAPATQRAACLPQPPPARESTGVQPILNRSSVSS